MTAVPKHPPPPPDCLVQASTPVGNLWVKPAGDMLVVNKGNFHLKFTQAEAELVGDALDAWLYQQEQEQKGARR